MNNLLRKLNSQTGESLGETLVAMLVVSLGVVMLITMVNASYRMIQNSDEIYDEYKNVHNVLAKHSGNAKSGNANFHLKSGDETITENNISIYTDSENDDEDLFVYEAQ